MAPAKVHLVGEVHDTPFSRQRYLQALRSLQPDVVFGEAHDLSIQQKILRQTVKALRRQSPEEFAEQSPINYAWMMDYQMKLPGAVQLYNQETGKTIPYVHVDEVGHILRTKDEVVHREIPKADQEKRWKPFLNLDDPVIRLFADTIGARFEKLRSYDPFPTRALRTAIKDIFINGAVDEIVAACPLLDVPFHFPLDEIPGSLVENIKQRDDSWLEKIMGAEGEILLACGAGHIFGAYENIYERVRQIGVQATRSTLIEYTPSQIERPGTTPISREEYLEVVKGKAQQYL